MKIDRRIICYGCEWFELDKCELYKRIRKSFEYEIGMKPGFFDELLIVMANYCKDRLVGKGD